jgi:pimeloyl-ACP methyl ester carboxylesterase
MTPPHGVAGIMVVESAKPDARQIVLVHGAANSAKVWHYWQTALAERGWTSHAVDLRGHGLAPGDLSRATMDDYAADVGQVVASLPERPAIMRWSMGGLVAMIVAAQGGVTARVGLAPSTPARSVDPEAGVHHGVFGPEEYGIVGRDVDDQPTMPDLDREERGIALTSLSNESRLARDQRKAGVVIESLPCPLLIVTGAEDQSWPRSAYDGLWLNATHVEVARSGHWGLVLSRRALGQSVPQVADFLTTAALHQ